MMVDTTFAWFVSYKRYEDDPISTNIVYAMTSENVDREFGKCFWYSMRLARDDEIAMYKKRGMPIRWV